MHILNSPIDDSLADLLIVPRNGDGSCQSCLDAGNKDKEDISYIVEVYDIQSIAGQKKPNMQKARPYLRLTACDQHLLDLVRRCQDGSYEEKRNGKGGFYARVFGNDIIVLRDMRRSDKSKAEISDNIAEDDKPYARNLAIILLDYMHRR